MAAGWFAAWSEHTPAEWRRQAFTPLWLGYVLVMNALAYRRTGPFASHRPARWFAALFPASAAFWWLFEYLNQFVRNWHYIGIQASGDWDYFLQGTLPFSTVLPAIASTWMWLRQFRGSRRCACRPCAPARPPLGWPSRRARSASPPSGPGRKRPFPCCGSGRCCCYAACSSF